jgi:hypothetical protein
VRTLDDVRRRLETLRGHCTAVGRPYEAILTSHLALPLIAAETASAVSAKLDARFGALPPEQQARRRAAVVAGTPGELVAYYGRLVEAGLRYFVAAIDADDTASLELLGERVVPAVVEAAGQP